jgi:hypothetical protein
MTLNSKLMTGASASYQDLDSIYKTEAYSNINAERSYKKTKVISLLLAVSVGINCYYYSTNSNLSSQQVLAQGDLGE